MPELTSAFVALSADVVAAYVSNNSVTQSDLPALIASVHGALRDAANGKQQAEKVVLEPPVSIKKSISASHLISRRRAAIQVAKAPPHGAGPHSCAVSGEVVTPV